MVRPTAMLLAAAVALAGPGVASTHPQQPGRPAVLMLRNAAGQPVEGAVGLVLADARRELPALAELGGLELFAQREPTVIGAGPSRRTGMLMCGGGQNGGARPGAVLILADGPPGESLADLVPRLLPGDADRVQLQPAALVSGPTPDQPITLFPALLFGDRRIVLPALRGTAIPLPAGRYEAWVEQQTAAGATEVTWQLLTLVAGENATVDFGGPTRPLRRPDGATVTPAGRPDVVLVDEQRAICMLRGQAVSATFTASKPSTGRLITGSEIRFADDEPTLAIRPDFAALPAGPDSEPARAFVLRRTAFGSWQVHGASVPDDTGSFRLPHLQGGDDWLLVVAPGHAPFAIPLARASAGQPLAIAAGTPLCVTCRLDNGDPARDVLLDYVPRDRDAATIALRTDRYGRADFGRITLPGTLRASDPRYANTEQQLDAVAEGGVSLTLESGFTVRGTVTLLDDSGAGGVTVTLSAPHDQLRPRERSTVTAADGSFTFPGLVEGHEYVLFATTRRVGRTWSSKVGRFLASDQTLRLMIQNEDPQFLPDRRR